MFSQRTAWTRQLNALAIAVTERRAAGLPLDDLTVSNPTACGLAYPFADLREALARGASAPYAPEPRGLLSAREAVCAAYAAEGLTVAPDDLFLTASTSEAYAHVFALLCDPGDEVLVPVPSYPLFDYLLQLACARPVAYPLRYAGGWQIDQAALRAAATARTRAVIAVAPHNPAGVYLANDDRDALAGFCAERSLALVVDEVFRDYPHAAAAPVPVPPSTAGERRCVTFTLNGISKSLGLPQYKLGWIAVSGPAAARQEATTRLEIVADTYLSAGTPVQAALPALMTVGAAVRAAIAQRIRANLAVLAEATGGDSPLSRLRAEGGWSAILRVPGSRPDEDLAVSLVERHGVLVHPGHFFDLPARGYLVVSLLADPGALARGLALLREECGEHT
ncbi:MAG: pyridoxal phosphate-dependent aminotransferase [Candidatus Krumholzibacteria bacterium]|jgi:aspartate/methionine/tyrosine aminotransferase|nr:pyridoxal phosphate-dependent aminotransferase [Candidatus Krumholzibacteria bacterium]